MAKSIHAGTPNPGYHNLRVVASTDLLTFHDIPDFIRLTIQIAKALRLDRSRRVIYCDFRHSETPKLGYRNRRAVASTDLST